MPGAGRLLVVIGASGVARNVVEVAGALGRQVIALVDETGKVPAGSTHAGVPVGHHLEPWLEREDVDLAVAIGDNARRDDRVRQLAAAGIGTDRLPSLVHPAATVSPAASLGAGSLVLAGARVHANAQVGPYSSLMGNAVVTHNGCLARAVSLAPGAVLGGWCTVGTRTAIGLNAAIREGVQVGADVVIGAGAAVLDDTPDEVVMYGVPARVARSRQPGERYLWAPGG